MQDKAPSWGIEPVPPPLRVLGLADTMLLWGNLGVSLLVLVAAAFLVPALSLRDALVAIVLGSLIGNLMLGAAGLIGADARVPAMVLLRAPLGQRGSYLPTGLNVLQCLGWAVFELIIIASAATALSKELLDAGATWFWTLVFGAVAATMALIGPVGVVRRFIRKYAVWAVAASLLYLTWWALADADLRKLWDAPAEGGSSIWLGIDLVVAITVSWTPLVADYTRFSRDRRSAFLGAGIGYFVAGTWMFLLGAFLVLSRGLADPAEVPAAVAAAGFAAALALLAVTVDEADEAFANVYSTAVSLQNLLPRLPQRLLVGFVAVLATVGALTIQLRNYETFLLLLGSFFVPLFGVLLADWLLRGARYGPDEVFRGPAVRPATIAAWLAGFALYHWLHVPPLGPSWWVDWVEAVGQPSWEYGATLPTFAAAFALAALAVVVERRLAPGRLRVE
ncbi:MAG: cytosine permease [Thermoleophilia bacterium]|nr:cytosine permease [Thermoleophilia bacterium]